MDRFHQIVGAAIQQASQYDRHEEANVIDHLMLAEFIRTTAQEAARQAESSVNVTEAMIVTAAERALLDMIIPKE